MSQLDQVRDVLKRLERVAEKLVQQGDSEALRDFQHSLADTNNYFGAYADEQEEAIIAAGKQALDEEKSNKDGLSFDLDDAQDVTPPQPITPQQKEEPTAQLSIFPSESQQQVKKQHDDAKQKAIQQDALVSKQQLDAKVRSDLKAFKDIELYIGDKFTQYGCTFEQDLFTPNDPLKIGLIHLQALLLIFRKLGLYLTPAETTLLLSKFKPTKEQVEDYMSTHHVGDHNLPIAQHFVNYSLLFLYLQALNNVALSTRSAIQTNVPALMAGRALQYQPSNPHPLDPLKSDAKIEGLVLEKDSARQIASFNEPLAQTTVLSQHANKPKESIIDLVLVQKLIKDFAGSHPSPSRIYSSIKRSTAHTENVSKYGENTMTIDALVAGLKTFNFKLSELPCSIDIFKGYIELYSAEGIPAIRFPEFISFLNCEEPKNGWKGLLAPINNIPTNQQNQLDLPSHKKAALEETKPQSGAFVQVITAVVNDSGFSQALVNLSAANPRQLFRHMARGDNHIKSSDIINYLIDSRCPERLILNDNFKTFVGMYSTTRDDRLNYNDFILFKDCKVNFVSILNGTFTKNTIVPDDTGLYTSFKLISDHFSIVNPHLSFHHCVQAVVDHKIALNQIDFYNTLFTAKVIISYDQSLLLFDQLNATVAQPGQLTEDVVLLHPNDPARQTVEGSEGSLIVPLVYFPLNVLAAIIQNPIVYPLIQKSFTAETGIPHSTHTATTKRAANSNATALNDDSDLIALMNQLCLTEDEKKPKTAPSQRFQSSLIQDMTDESYNSLANHELQQGTRQHFKDHIQARKQIRTSIGFGTRNEPNTTKTSDSVTTEDAELIHHQRIANQSAELSIGFGAIDHGGRTPIKSREGYYPHAKQTYSLMTAVDEKHENELGDKKSTRKTLTTFGDVDEYELSMQSRAHHNPRSFTSSVLKLRATPVQSRPARQPMAPQTKVVLGLQPDAVFTPQKANQRRKVFPNRNQTAVQMQFQSPGIEDKQVVKYHRGTCDLEQTRQALGHLNDGFQPADTPFLLRRQGKFAKLTQKDQVLLDDFEYATQYEKVAELVNPRDKTRRRTGYMNQNNVTELMAFEHSHVDNQFVNDIDAAVLNHTDLAQYIIDNTNRSYKDLASRQLISVKRSEPVPVLSAEPVKTPGFEPQDDGKMMDDDEQGAVFTLDDVGPVVDVVDVVEALPVATPVEEDHNDDQNDPEVVLPGQLTQSQLKDLNVGLTRLSFRIGKSRDVFSKWSEYTNTLTAHHLHKALTSNDFTVTVQNAQQLIDSVNQEHGGVLNLSGFSRLLGRGAD